jgi:hypothetical protein
LVGAVRLGGDADAARDTICIGCLKPSAGGGSPSVAPIELPTDIGSAAGVEWEARWDETDLT